MARFLRNNEAVQTQDGGDASILMRKLRTKICTTPSPVRTNNVGRRLLAHMKTSSIKMTCLHLSIKVWQV